MNQTFRSHRMIGRTKKFRARHLSGAALLFGPLLFGTVAAGCSDDSPMVQVDEDRLQFVRDYAEHTLLPTLDAFVTEADALAAAVDAWVADPSDANRTAAQMAWRRAMEAWQRAELMTVGPAGPMTDVAGGEDLRDDIYSWPVTNTCRVDQETIEESFQTPEGLAEEAVNTRGLDALEYLLFVDSEENTCSVANRINRDGLWMAAAADVPANRRRYAASAATLLARNARTLVDAWRNGFQEKLTTTPNDVYPSNQEALNAITDALFYLDKEVKDMKLAEPAGLAECDMDTCPEQRESRIANVSLVAVERNLEAFAAVFRGAEGRVGLEELLQRANAADLATRMNAAIDEALTQVRALSGDIPTLLADNPRALMALYDAVKGVTDLLKTEFISVLDLELPSRAEGDND